MSLKKIDYARISTKDQDLHLQHEALNQVNCDKVYEDKASGTKASRNGLNLALEVLREDDSLVVWKLNRLGRSVKDLVTMVGELLIEHTSARLKVARRRGRVGGRKRSMTDSKI